MSSVLRGRARWLFVLLFLLALYPNHYGLWSTWNYLNEGFYPMLLTQLYFAATELIIGAVIVAFVSAETPLHPAGLWIILHLSLTHLAQNWIDQKNPLLGVAIMFYVDVANVVAALACLIASVGKPVAVFAALRPAAGASRLLLGSREAAPSPPPDRAALAVYSLDLAMRDAAIGLAATLINLVLLNTFIISSPLVVESER